MRGQRPFSINYVPWNELQQFRCKEAELGERCKHVSEDEYLQMVDTGHLWTIGGSAYYVPKKLHKGYVTKAFTEAREYLAERGFI